jgi:hypothetical protein
MNIGELMVLRARFFMKRFFISGCQRSGTTMLRLVLESHPGIQCFDESVGYDLLVREAREEGWPVLQVDPEASLQGFKIPRFAEQLTRQGFSDPDYGVFPSFYNDEKVIHVFRDVLDVVGSMMKLKATTEASWLEKYGLRILGAMVLNPNADGVFKEKYKELERRGMPLHLVGALYWEIKNQGYFDLQRLGKPVFAVKYEHLVASPKQELQQICRFLGIEWSDVLLNHPAHPHGELNERGYAIGETDPRRSIDTSSVGGYRNLLNEQQAFEINSLMEDMRHRLECEIRCS